MATRWHLFEVTGIELEYMIVDRDDFRIRPICDVLMQNIAGAPVNEINDNLIGWSNELARHVLEFKCREPVTEIASLLPLIRAQIDRANTALLPLQAQLMGSGCHPFMDPLRETELWPHELNEVYTAFNRIFDCRGHGWSNLQSMHINLPFADDNEFAQLHSAIRFLLPLLPALSASTPIIGASTGPFLDNRLHYYGRNCARVPLATGLIVPEPSHSEAHYRAMILQPLYAQIAPLDPDGLLQDEWLNARGAIARFDRNAIEIRVLDVQETPEADLLIAELVVASLRYLVETARCGPLWDARFTTGQLAGLLQTTIESGEAAIITDAGYCQALSVPVGSTAGAIWQSLCVKAMPAARQPELLALLARGSLARRLLAHPATVAQDWPALCRALTAALAQGHTLSGPVRTLAI